MPGLGCYYMLSEAEEALFEAIIRKPDAIDAFIVLVTEHIKKPRCHYVDKGWDPVHRCLTNGNLHYGSSPRYRCVLGNKNLMGEESYQFVNYLKPAQVARTRDALDETDEPFLRRNYDKIDPDDYTWEKSEEDFGYILHFFKMIRRFYRRAAKAHRPVLFHCTL